MKEHAAAKMIEKKPLSQVEQQRIREASEKIRTIAKVIKALVHKHYPEAVFDTLPEDKDAFNIEGVHFERASPCSDGAMRPAFAMLSFTIGPEERNSLSDTEKARQALTRDLERLFDVPSGNTRFTSHAGSVFFNGVHAGAAVAYGTPEKLYQNMQQTMAEHAELCYLLPHNHSLRARTSRTHIL